MSDAQRRYMKTTHYGPNHVTHEFPESEVTIHYCDDRQVYYGRWIRMDHHNTLKENPIPRWMADAIIARGIEV